jgi:hypothetical protein
MGYSFKAVVLIKLRVVLAESFTRLPEGLALPTDRRVPRVTTT